jgi:hypothetical protein
MRTLVIIVVAYLVLTWLQSSSAPAVPSAPASSLGVQGLPASVAVPAAVSLLNDAGPPVQPLSIGGTGPTGITAGGAYQVFSGKAVGPAPVFDLPYTYY